MMRTIALLLLATIVLTHGNAKRAEMAESIEANDNRVAAGLLKDGVLTVNLEVRRGSWFPDGPGNPSVDVHAFAEAGKALQVPGPLLRVSEGTEIRASIRNALDTALIVHGLYTRDNTARSGGDTLHIAPRETREVRFIAGRPGTYYYWAATNAVANWATGHLSSDTQLAGAFIIDPRGTSGAARDRVLMLAVWYNTRVAELTDGTNVITRFVINGRTWPNTERLSYSVGDSIRLRLINASADVHPMHLHGFYFRVHSRGAEEMDTIYAASAPPDLVVTERVAPGRTATVSWSPERAGNWLFHCHTNLHIQPSRPFDGSPRATPAHVQNHATELMGGLVLGIEVKPTGAAAKSSEPDRRRLRLVARAGPNGTPSEPLYGFVLQSDARAANVDPPKLPGPTIVLRRGEPVAITVVNELPEATSVHWHGIELESYFDGVADFAGLPGRLAPAIAPRDSFEARFTPPRAGTFIYHTHVDEVRQQRAGLSGALLVLEPGERYDPAADLVMLISTPLLDADRGIVMLNGTTSPQPLDLQLGKRYRLRVINIHTYRPSIRVELKRDSTLMTWRALAKDGAALPGERATIRRSAVQIGNGETYDFEFTPAERGALRLDILRGNGLVMLTQLLNVR